MNNHRLEMDKNTHQLKSIVSTQEKRETNFSKIDEVYHAFVKEKLDKLKESQFLGLSQIEFTETNYAACRATMTISELINLTLHPSFLLSTFNTVKMTTITANAREKICATLGNLLKKAYNDANSQVKSKSNELVNNLVQMPFEYQSNLNAYSTSCLRTQLEMFNNNEFIGNPKKSEGIKNQTCYIEMTGSHYQVSAVTIFPNFLFRLLNTSGISTNQLEIDRLTEVCRILEKSVSIALNDAGQKIYTSVRRVLNEIAEIGSSVS